MATEPLRGAEDLRIAIIVDPDLPLGLLANTVATIAIGLGGCHPAVSGVRLVDAQGIAIRASADRPVAILQADGEALHELLSKAAPREGEITTVVFPSFARSVHSFVDYEQIFPTRSLLEDKIDGVGLAGSAKLIRSLTGSFKLLRQRHCQP